jgi:transcriptional regulator with XRE-family HTH domain
MDALVSAIRKLRSKLGDSQQTLANRLALSWRAVANYEAGRRPTGRVLYQLANLAHEHGYSDLARVFADAFSTETSTQMEPTTAEERIWIGALLSILRTREEEPSNWRSVSDSIIAGLSALVSKAKGQDRKDLETLLVHTRLNAQGSALQLINKLMKERREKTGETPERALLEVLQDNPELYAKYQAERTETMQNTHAQNVTVGPKKRKRGSK